MRCPVYVFYLMHHDPEQRLPLFEAFRTAFFEHSSGVEHCSVVVLVRDPSPAFADTLPWLHVRLPPYEKGFDLGAYRFGMLAMRPVDEPDYDPVCVFLNSYARPLRAGWLGALVATASREDVGIAGATGSHESPLTADGYQGFPPFPNPHVRTNAFAMRASVFRRLDWPTIEQKVDANRFECGPLSITQQVQAMNLKAFVVEQGHIVDVVFPNSFRTPNQKDNLLVSDNRTEQYEKAPPRERAALEKRTWGKALTDVPPESRKLEYPQRAVVNAFHQLYYDECRCFHEISWMGVPMQKYPNDLMVYQEIIFRCRPDVILETGTNNGASAHFLATMLALCEVATERASMRAYRVATVDIEHLPKPMMRGDIMYIQSSSTASGTLRRMSEAAEGAQTMVVLDSDHAEAHVYRELELYAPLVSVGQYLIVEDTNVNGHPVNVAHGPGPWEAVTRFLETDLGRCFDVDRSCEKLLLTANPRGYLKRVR